MNLARLLLEGFRWFDDGLRARLSSEGFPELTTAQSMVFPYLDREGTRPSELARRLGITRQSAHTLIAGLKELGMVSLADDPEDRRSKVVVLTDEGTRSVPVALAVFEDLELELRRRIGSRRADGLREGLETGWGEPPGVGC